MWGYGFLICPAISGYLSDPVKAYPDSALVQAFEPQLSAFPFVLPNLVGAFLCLASFVAVTSTVEETLPEENCQKLTIKSLFTSCTSTNQKDDSNAVVDVPRGGQVEKQNENTEEPA